MSLLSYRCPNTSNEVVTTIDTDRPALARMRNLKVAVLCPYCPGGHSIPADTMYFGLQATLPVHPQRRAGHEAARPVSGEPHAGGL
jgi:hypothetical protein